MKKFFKFIIILLPWFLSGLLFSSNINSFFNELKLPFFALPENLYGIVWTILYILISISIYKIYTISSYKYTKDYNKALISNYIFNQLYLFFIFSLENTFLGFVSSIGILITSLLLYYETKEIDIKSSKYLLPYVFFNIYATILSFTIYLLNI